MNFLFTIKLFENVKLPLKKIYVYQLDNIENVLQDQFDLIYNQEEFLPN